MRTSQIKRINHIIVPFIAVLFAANVAATTPAKTTTAISKPLTQSTVMSSNLQGRININTATAKELTTLHGIGRKKAQAIVDYREMHGPFTTLEDLQQVKGISTGIVKKITSGIRIE